MREADDVKLLAARMRFWRTVVGGALAVPGGLFFAHLHPDMADPIVGLPFGIWLALAGMGVVEPTMVKNWLMLRGGK